MVHQAGSVLLACVVGLAGVLGSAAATSEGPYAELAGLLSESRKERRAAARRLIKAGDRSLVPGLVDAVFFVPRADREEIFEVLEALTGERHDGYYEWVEYVGAHAEIEPREGYAEWKTGLLARIDADYRAIFYPGAPARIRLEEIVSGGVPLDGIPSLDDPPVISAAEARYLRPEERVFGAVVGGEARAYPLRILSWHEMLNDVVGGQPVTLSYCTLCGSGILYSAATPAGGRYLFGTSGLLYRSNKLMFDRSSYTLWSNLTGEPVVGRLAQSPIRLEVLPATLTTWEDWRDRQPGTLVLDLEAIERQVDRRHGFDYRPGAADDARRGVSFPVWQRSDLLERDDEILALRVDGVPKAYPVETMLSEGVVNDRVGERPVVIVGDPKSGAVRAYLRGERRFRAGEEPALLLDEGGHTWEIDETALRPAGDAAGAEPLPRVPGHIAFWFGWYAFYPQTELYGEGGSGRLR